jgi:hypothetical protein
MPEAVVFDRPRSERVAPPATVTESQAAGG